MAAPLRFTARALAQFRKLAEPYHSQALALCQRLEADPVRFSKKLAGGASARRSRTKTSDVRIAWVPDTGEPNGGAPLVFWVGVKDDRTYADIGRASPFGSRVCSVDEVEGELALHAAADAADVPAYRRVGTWDGAAWRAMLYGDYARSPRLTRSQWDDFARILWDSGDASDGCVIVRGGAGSGKSVCALLWACRLRSDRAGAGIHHVTYLAPPALVDRFHTFPEVQQHLDPAAAHVRSVDDWFASIVPDAAPYDRAKALDAFRAAAERARRSRRGPDPFGEIRPSDPLVYEAFVLGERGEKDAAADEHAGRADALRSIPPEIWEEELAARGTRSRTAIAQAVQAAPPAPPSEDRALLVVDEAQDLLVEELKAVRAVWDAWTVAGRETRLWLFGDLNQRITPSGFTWADVTSRVGLHTVPIDLDRNYRNPAAVLDLAARVHTLAQDIAREHGRRHLPRPSVAGVGTADQEPVQAIRMADEAAAVAFVQSLRPTGGAGDRHRYLRAHLASKPQVLSPRPWPDLENALVHVPHTVKGAELEAALAIGLFENAVGGSLTLQLLNACYTLVTRVRSRLLLVLTDAEHEWAARHGLLDHVSVASPDEAATWIMELGSAVDLSADPDDTLRRLCEPAPAGGPWLDTWDALVEAGLTERVGEWERRASAAWAPRDLEALAAAADPWLRALAFAHLGDYSSAEGAALAFRDADGAPTPEVQREASRLFRALARCLEQGGRPYEAHRLQARRLEGYVVPPDIPMPDLDPHLPLGEAVLRAARGRLQALTAPTA